MDSFDVSILMWLNQFARHNYTFDAIVVVIAGSSLFKGFVLMTVFWWEWFRQSEDQKTRREIMFVNLLSCLAVIAVTRGLANLLPYKARPLQTAGLAFDLPFTMNPEMLEGWSSFPSDHAALFFCLATGLWFAQRRLGMAAFAYVFVFISLPRVYVGLHNPSDIIAGALVGIAGAGLTEVFIGRRWRGQWLQFWWTKSRPVLYTGLFVLSFQIAVLFEPIRALGRVVLDLVLHTSA